MTVELIIEETVDGTVVKPVVDKTAELIVEETVGGEVVKPVADKYSVVSSSAANYAPPGPPGPAGGGTVGLGVGPGRRFQLMRSNNASSLFGATQGTEYAIGISLPDLAIAAVALHINAGDEGSRFRVGLRPVNGSEIGAPVMDAEFDASLSGMQEVAVDATIPAGAYAMTWVRYGDDGNTMRAQRSAYDLNPHLWPLWSSTSWTATGHGPVHGLINTGISGPLPTTVSFQNVQTNQEGGSVPQIQVRLAT